MTQDLTRWNRAGLSRFRYVDANAATHLEALRIELADRFEDWRRIAAKPPPDETAAERTVRLLEQYHDDRRDWAWEATRAFARALHILTEHIDAFANEGYLRTATQWQSIRRLAAMVGYASAPASSATTPLVLIAKAGVEKATVSHGFAVKHVPPGGSLVIFETLEDLDIAFALNGLRLKGWDRNATPLSPDQVFAANAADGVRWPLPKGSKIGIGELAILQSDERAAPAVLVPARVATNDGTALTLSAIDSPAFAGLTVDTARLHVAPSQILVPRLNGADVVRVSSPHGLVAGDVVAWKEGSSVHFAAVTDADAGAVRLRLASGVSARPSNGTLLLRASSISFAQYEANRSEWRLPSAMALSSDFRVTWAGSDGALRPGLGEGELRFSEPETGDHVKLGYRVLGAAELAGARTIWYADPGKDKPVAGVRRDLPAYALEFDGKPPALAPGNQVIVQTGNLDAPGYAARRISQIRKDAGSYRIEFATEIGTAAVSAVHAVFGATLHPAGYRFDPSSIAGDQRDIELEPGDEWPGLLRRGRQLVLASRSDAFAAFEVTIEALGPEAWTIRVDRPPPAGAAIQRGDLVIHANVVDAGHGETKPLRRLGSGNASATNQRLAIDFDDVSQVRDAAMPGGVRADVKIEVEHEIYAQVASLRDSGPADPHYVARITEAGTLELEFGDGRHGRRLPTGSNNVLATIRRGAGLSGNVPAGALTDIVKKHPAIDTVRQPIATAGGDERESIEQIRQNAPGRLTAMDRAISVADYQRLAQRFQGVWHAAAFEQPSFRRSRAAVRVVIVPAGGGALGNLAEQIRSFLAANGLPSIDIIIAPFAALPVEIAVTVRVDSTRYDPIEVEGRVRAALLAAFDLRRRRPGQPLYRSEVIRAVENVDGVSNSDVVLFASVPPRAPAPWEDAARGDDGGIWAVFPKDDQVIYAKLPALVTVTTAEATL